MSRETITNREKGPAVPASIGTALAIESICNLGEFEEKKKPAIFKYDLLLINLRTLFRNTYGSLDNDSRANVNEDQIIEGMLDDINVIQSTIEHITNSSVKVRFFYCKYSGLDRIFPNAKWKELKTDKQKVEAKLEETCIKNLERKQKQYKVFDGVIDTFDVKLGSFPKKTLLLTHYPCDLLWYKNFIKLSLLESHTGKIKDKDEWHTKLTGAKDYTRIPFNKLTIQVFGDNSILFASMLPTIKKRVLEIAEKDQWTSISTDARVRASIDKIYDPREKLFFKSLLD